MPMTLSLRSLDLISQSQQMCRNLLHGPSRLQAYSYIHHCSQSRTIIFLSSTNIVLSFNALFTLSIYPIHAFSLSLTPFTSDPTILFTNRSSSNLSMCPNYLNTLLCSISKLVTLVLLYISFLTQSICITPYILLRYIVSITFHLFFSATTILRVWAPSHNLLFTFIPIALQLNTFITISLILDFICL